MPVGVSSLAVPAEGGLALQHTVRFLACIVGRLLNIAQVENVPLSHSQLLWFMSSHLFEDLLSHEFYIYLIVYKLIYMNVFHSL